MQVYFGGDTGYCAVEDGDHDLNPELPYCPACTSVRGEPRLLRPAFRFCAYHCDDGLQSKRLATNFRGLILELFLSGRSIQI